MSNLIKLDENGMAVWRHKTNQNLFVERTYEWCNRVIILDESEEREVIDDLEFSTFDFSDWTPMTVEEYQRVKRKYKEIYDV